MKPSVKAHATVTAHDSLDGHGVHIPAPMLRPSRYMFATSGWGGPVFKEAVSRVKAGKSFTMDMFSPRGYGYAEAQIHGGHGTVSNIEHLIFGKGVRVSKIVKERLRAEGITWSREGKRQIYR